MSIDQHVNVTVRINSAGIPRQGFGTIGILTYATVFPEVSRTYRRLADLIADGFAADSPEAIALGRILGQTPHPQTVKLLRGSTPPTQRYRIDVDAVALGRSYGIQVEGEGVTSTEVKYTTLADFTFVDGDVTVGTDTIAEVGHGMSTGDGPYRVSNAGGALPTGLAVDTNYWIIAPTADTFKLASSKANALALTPVDITAAAGGGTHTVRRNQNDVIIAQLEQGLNAVPGKNYTAAQQVGAGETDYLLVTATNPADWFSLEVLDGQYDNLNIAQNHADPGIATDLNTIVLTDNDWYYLHTMYNSEDMVKATAEWIEAQTFKFYALDMCDTLAEDGPAAGGDVFDDLEALEYKRTHYAFKRSPAQMYSAGLMGRLASLPVGSWTAAYKTVVGCTPDRFNATQITNLDAKRANYYKEEATLGISWEGRVANSEYLYWDVVTSLDFMVDALQKAGFGVMKALDKVAYTDEDLAILRRAFEGVIAAGKSDKHKIVAPGTPGDPDDPEPSVIMPLVADIDPNARALRELPDVEVNFRIQGAVHTLDVTLTVTF